MEFRIIISAIACVFTLIYLLVKKKSKIKWSIIFSIVLFPTMLLITKGVQIAFLEGSFSIGLDAMKNIIDKYSGIYLLVLIFMIICLDQLFNKNNNPDKKVIRKKIVLNIVHNGELVSSKTIIAEKKIDPPVEKNICHKCGVELENKQFYCDNCFHEQQEKDRYVGLKIIVAVYLMIYVGLFLFASGVQWLGGVAYSYNLWDYMKSNLPFAFYIAAAPCFGAIVYSIKLKRKYFIIFNILFFIVNIIFFIIYS